MVRRPVELPGAGVGPSWPGSSIWMWRLGLAEPVGKPLLVRL